MLQMRLPCQTGPVPDWRIGLLRRQRFARRSADLAPQQKTPRRGGGALLGLLQGGEIFISIYVDPWEVGEPGLCRVRRCGKQRGDISTRGSTKKSCRCSLIGFLLRILEQRTNVCAICV